MQGTGDQLCPGVTTIKPVLQNPGAQSSSVQLLKPAHHNRETHAQQRKLNTAYKKKKKRERERKKELYGWGFNSGFISKILFIPNIIVTICATTCALTIFQGAPLHLQKICPLVPSLLVAQDSHTSIYWQSSVMHCVIKVTYGK